MFRNPCTLLAMVAFAVPSIAEAPKASVQPEPKTEVDDFAVLVQTLHGKKVKFPNSLKDTPLRTLKEQLEKQFDVKIVVREDLFKAQDMDNPIMDRKFALDSNLSGLPLETFLRIALQDIKATFLVRKDYLEITTWEGGVACSDDPALAKILKEGNPEAISLAIRDFIRDTPLVSGIVKEQPLERAIASLTETYGFTVIVAVQAAEHSKTNVSARLMNVPFPTALDVLALNAGLKVVRRENTFIVTTVEHAANLKAKAIPSAKAPMR